jgi:hypothetical protein
MFARSVGVPPAYIASQSRSHNNGQESLKSNTVSNLLVAQQESRERNLKLHDAGTLENQYRTSGA